MTKRIYYEFFYYHSIPEMILWGVLLVILWNVLAVYCSRRHPRLWMNMNRAVLIVTVIFILYWTLGRRGSGERELSLIPFYSFVAAQTSSERYRSLVANVLLFVPVGLTMPFALCGHPSTVLKLSRSQPLNVSTAQCEQGTDISRALETGSSGDLETSERESVETGRTGDLETRNYHPVLVSILFAVLLSVSIELAQWKWGLGLAETDDVIMNTLGAAFGTLAFIFCSRVSRTHPHNKG